MGASAGPDIIDTGLVLALDAADRNSYNSAISATTWTDLSGRGNNGTLVNGVGYNNNNGGSLVFDGVNDYIIIATSPSIMLQSLTMESWFKANGSPTGGFHVLFQKEGGYSGGSVYGLRSNNGSTFYAMICYDAESASQNQLQSTTTISNGTWYHIVSTFDSSYNWKIYINGSLENSTTLTRVPFQNDREINIGTGDGRFTNGNIPIVKLYNRALSSQEISQNFNMMRSRFGI